MNHRRLQEELQELEIVTRDDLSVKVYTNSYTKETTEGYIIEKGYLVRICKDCVYDLSSNMRTITKEFQCGDNFRFEFVYDEFCIDIDCVKSVFDDIEKAILKHYDEFYTELGRRAMDEIRSEG